MSTDKSTLYGIKSLLECLSRATLLAQPDDIPEFLSTYVGEITQSRDDELRDTKEVAFQYQEQWENTILAKESKRKETRRPAPEESCSSASSVSSTASASFIVSPPHEVRQRTSRVSSVRVSSREDSMGEEISPSCEPRPVPSPPYGEMVKTRHRVSSVRIPSEEDSVGLNTEKISTSCVPRPVSPPTPPPWRERVKTHQVPSVRIPSQEDSVGLNIEMKSPSSERRPVPQPPPPRGERVKTYRESSVRIPQQKERKPSLPSAFPVLPPIPQKAQSQVSKQVQGQKPSKGHRNREYTCRLNDCPYHNIPKEEPEAERELEPVRSSTLPTVKFEKSPAGLRISEIHIPYKPKGGRILDPELVPKRTRAGTMTNRRTVAESTLLHRRQDTAYSRPGTMSGGTKNLDLSQESLECAIHTLPNLAHSVHIIRYRRTHLHCSELQPQSARWSDIDLPPNLQQVSRNSTPSDCSRSSSAMCNSPSLPFSY